jgi:uncharacterized LabA/DUF88 family protein
MVTNAYCFIGYIENNTELYTYLQESGFILVFKSTYIRPDGRLKGNVDAELVLWTMHEINNYNKAVIVTGDGDFACLVNYLNRRNKLCCLLVPNSKKYSALLKKAAGQKIRIMDDLKNILRYKKTSTQ